MKIKSALAIVLTLAAQSTVNAQDFIDMSGFDQIGQGTLGVSTMSTKAAPSEPTTTITSAEQRKAFCASVMTETSINIEHATIAMNAIDIDLRSPQEQAVIRRLANNFIKEANSFVNKCKSNSATLGRTRKAYENVAILADQLFDKVGDIK